MSSCPICTKHQETGNVIYENDHWVISHSPVSSQLLGYLYLEPKRHVENWTDFSESELEEIGLLIKKTESGLKEVLPLERLYVVTISEAVRHIHFHLIPRLADQELKGVQLIQQATQQEIKGTALTESDVVHLGEYLKNSF